MKVIKLIMIASCSIAVVACSSGVKSIVEPTATENAAPQICSNEWFTKIERELVTGDGQGHGPDLGSLEWRSVIEFKLGIRGDSSVPARDSALWCDYIEKIYTAR